MAATTSGDDRVAVVALASLPGMGPARLRRLMDIDGPAGAWRRLLAGDRNALAAAGCARPPEEGHAESAWRRCQASGVTVLAPGDDLWPRRLLADPEPPAVLFTTGPVPDGPAVAVVGTRRCSGYGRRVAGLLGAGLAAAGVGVVSGVATGIDAAAQRAALDAGGAAVTGVVGSGLDVVYPARNRALWSDLAARGVLVSEAPPGARPLPWRFPARNRIIAALADVVVVVESGAAGGSMHTVEAAQQRGRPVMAVPGPITAATSAGTNRLLAEGCAPVCDLEDVLVAVGLERASAGAGDPAAAEPVDGGARRLLEDLGWEPASVDELVLRSGLALAEVTGGLATLATRGVVRDVGGWWERVR